ncbi:MAG: glycosyltransferase family 4 protein [Actinobacteria bacterium]|nr:glycosyltransferase family 4 protein [Actinomycetota bacterium]
MRILLITEYLPATYDAEITGGVEAYCHYVRRHLSKEHEIVVLARLTDGRVWDDASIRSIPGRLWFLVATFVRGLTTQADVIVGTTNVVHGVAWLVARLKRRPVVFWYADVLIGHWRSDGFGRAAGWVGETVERVLLKLPVDRYIAISDSTAAKLVSHGVQSQRVTVVPCGFEPQLVASVVPAELPPRSVVTVSRLVPYKRVDVVVRAVAELYADFSDLRLVVIGQGPEMGGLLGLADALGVRQCVDIRGFVPSHRDVLATIAGSAVLVSASEIEGFGIVVVEAMALGVPYVVSDIPAHREVTGGGVGGTLFPAGDHAALATELKRLLSDPLPARGARDAARRHAEKYAWPTIAHETARILEQVVENARIGSTARLR